MQTAYRAGLRHLMRAAACGQLPSALYGRTGHALKVPIRF
jgi:hypothetical protein